MSLDDRDYQFEALKWHVKVRGDIIKNMGNEIESLKAENEKLKAKVKELESTEKAILERTTYYQEIQRLKAENAELQETINLFKIAPDAVDIDFIEAEKRHARILEIRKKHQQDVKAE